MPELDDIRALVEVVDSGGFALAARRLGVAKSIVSRRITRLEVELGARLLNRTARGASPTEAGAEFCKRATRALAELSEASDFVASRRGEVVGSLRVSLPLSFGLRRMAPIIASLHATYPRLEL